MELYLHLFRQTSMACLFVRRLAHPVLLLSLRRSCHPLLCFIPNRHRLPKGSTNSRHPKTKVSHIHSHDDHDHRGHLQFPLRPPATKCTGCHRWRHHLLVKYPTCTPHQQTFPMAFFHDDISFCHTHFLAIWVRHLDVLPPPYHRMADSYQRSQQLSTSWHLSHYPFHHFHLQEILFSTVRRAI